MMKVCKHCGDLLFYLNDALDSSDNGWKHIIDLRSNTIRILGNKGCNNPEPSTTKEALEE